jgi:hypothetical protein
MVLRQFAAWLVMLSTAFAGPMLLCDWACVRSDTTSHTTPCHQDTESPAATLASSHSCDHGSDRIDAATITASVALNRPLADVAALPHAITAARECAAHTIVEFPPCSAPRAPSALFTTLRI